MRTRTLYSPRKGEEKRPRALTRRPGSIPKSKIMSNYTNESLANFLKSAHWDAFFTATFARHQRFSGSAINSVIRKLSSPRLRPTKMFVAAEQHKLGGWHCHGLLEFPAGRSVGSDFLIASNKTILSELGFNMMGSIGNMDACSVYLSKYITKGEFHGDWQITGRSKFWRNGLTAGMQ